MDPCIPKEHLLRKAVGDPVLYDFSFFLQSFKDSMMTQPATTDLCQVAITIGFILKDRYIKSKVVMGSCEVYYVMRTKIL